MSESKQTGLIDVVNAYFNMRTAEEAEKANAQLASISDSIQREEIVAHRRRNAIQYILSTNELLGRIHAQGITTAKDWFSLLFAQQEAVIYGTVKLDNLQDAQALQEARQLANDYWVWAGETNQQHLGVLMSISKKAQALGRVASISARYKDEDYPGITLGVILSSGVSYILNFWIPVWSGWLFFHFTLWCVMFWFGHLIAVPHVKKTVAQNNTKLSEDVNAVFSEVAINRIDCSTTEKTQALAARLSLHCFESICEDIKGLYANPPVKEEITAVAVWACKGLGVK